jgi:hypothetical protein
MESVVRLRRLLESRNPPAQASQPEPAGKRCEFCDATAGQEHGHVVDIEQRGILCVCRPCYLLFANPAAAGGRYRAVPPPRPGVSRIDLSEALWDALEIPVGIAFVFLHSKLGRAAAFYPSPAGATESALPVSAWRDAVEANPVLGTLEPDVEALLISRLRGRETAFIVPIDACYELTGRLRRQWRGFDGGREAWNEIDAFFTAFRGGAG